MYIPKTKGYFNYPPKLELWFVHVAAQVARTTVIKLSNF